MEQARGFSYLYPVVPIMDIVSMFLLLLITPGFWKTRIVALVSLVGWLFVGNLWSFLGMIHWRGHTNDAPVWASILTTLGRTWSCGFFTSLACFAHFTWQRLQPLPVRKLYDTRRRDNLIHLFLTLILPVLWAPLFLFSCPARYIIFEDFGPAALTRLDWLGFVVGRAPAIISYMAIGIFNVLALVRYYWHGKQDENDADPLKPHSSVRTRKLLFMAVVNTPLAVYGICNQFMAWGSFGRDSPKSLAENIASLQLVFTVTRPDLDMDTSYESSRYTINAIFLPLLGFYLFAWFGFGAEARKSYGNSLLEFGRSIGVVGTLPSDWPAIALRKVKLQQSVADPLPPVQPNAPQITPYISDVPREHVPQPPANPAGMSRSDPIGNSIENKRRIPPKDPARRLSTHKPPFIPLDPANTTANTVALVPTSSRRRLSHHKPAFINMDQEGGAAYPTTSPTRRLSHHKPVLALLEAANAIRNTIVLEPNSAPHRIPPYQPVTIPLDPPNTTAFASNSPQHKPAFTPLEAANAMPNATPDPSGSTPQHIDDENNARRRAKFAPRSLARRLSYHKPAFVPLAPARGEILDPVETTIPPMEVRIEPTSNDDPELPEDSTMDDGDEPPPPRSNPPTYLSPSHRSSRSLSLLSPQRTPTPAPPYQDVNAFPSGTA